MNYIYPAVFEPDGEALKVTFPDLPAVITCGWSIEEAVAMAKGALGAYLDMCLDGNETLPTPTAPHLINSPSDGFVSLVDVDMARFRIQYGSKAVKKTLSLPEWMNNMAEERKLNFSAVLQKALREELGC